MLATRVRPPPRLAPPRPTRPRLLSVLSPPRSFSSVVSTMIGQHPEMYGFPELHLIMAETVQDVLSRERTRGKFLGPPGVLRSLAELDAGEQTAERVFDAYNWLYARRHWSSKQVMDHLMDRVAATRAVPICVEKSPSAATHIRYLNRQERFYPNALYLHVTRHPLSSVSSMEEYAAHMPRLAGIRGLASASGFAYWFICHRNIVTFTRAIPPERVLRVKGEDILSEPEIWLPKICRWAGVDDGAASVEAMLHPEASPYAGLGPANAKYGNDVKFVHSPKLRRGRVREGNLEEALSAAPLRDDITPEQKDHLLGMANFFGYR